MPNCAKLQLSQDLARDAADEKGRGLRFRDNIQVTGELVKSWWLRVAKLVNKAGIQGMRNMKSLLALLHEAGVMF